MRNLKRALSLGLTAAMISGLMVMGSSAASYADVTSENNVEAIDVLQTVGIMVGDENGNFNPDQNVTRNEMAVVMANLMEYNVASYKDTSPFTDVPSWAEPYVAACWTNGITAGYSDTIYGGSDTVTTAQAALMLMKALGYFQYASDFGSDWQLSTTRQGNAIDLFVGVDSGVTAPMTRNDVAQLVLNTLKSGTVEASTDGSWSIGDVTINNNVTYSFITSNQTYATAIDDARSTSNNSDAQRSIVELGEQLYMGDLKLNDNTTDVFGRPARYWEYEGSEIGTYAKRELLKQTYTTEVTGRDLYDLLGRSIIEDKDYSFSITIDGESEKSVLGDAYFTTGNMIRTNTEGVGATGNGVLTEVYLDTDKHEVNIAIINTYLAEATDDYDERKEEAEFDVYKISDDGHADQYVKTADCTESFEKISVDDFPIVADVKDGSFYLVTVADGQLQSIENVETVEETTISKFTKGKSVTSEGTEYKYASTAMYDEEVLDEYDQSNMKSTSYNIYLDPYGYLIGIDIVEEASRYLFLTGIDGNTSNLSNKTADANVIFLDGTMETVKVDMGDSEQSDGTDLVPAALLNTWCTYSVDKNGVYTLVQVADNKNDFERDEDNVAYADGDTDKMGQGWTKGADGAAAADIATIDKKHVSLDGIAAAGFDKVYGNDESIYITAEVDRINADTYYAANPNVGGSAVIISGVDSITTGVQNASLKAWNGQKVVDSSNNFTGVDDEHAAQGVYTLFKDNGYVIGAVVVGEDDGATTNYAYVISESGKDGLNMEAYDDTTEEYTWTRDVVVNGEVVELTEVDDGNPEIAGMTQNNWYEVKYYADGTVRSVTRINTDDGDRTVDSYEFYAQNDNIGNKFIGKIEKVEKSFDQGFDTVVLFENLMTKPYVISVKGNTLQVATDTATSKGFSVSASAKIVLVQDEKVKSDNSVKLMEIVEEYDNGVKGLEKAINDLNDNKNFKGYVSAVFEDGLATSVVIYDRTETIVDDGDNNAAIGMKVLDDAASNWYIGARIYTDGTWTPAKALNALAAAIRADGYSVTDVDATGTGGTLTWIDADGARRTVDYNDIDRVYLIKLKVEASKEDYVAVSPSEFYLAANEGKTITLTKTDGNVWRTARTISVTAADGAVGNLGSSTLDPVNGLVMTFDLPAWSFSKDETYTITISA